MKKLSVLTLSLLISLCLFAQTKAGKTDITKHEVFYTCPMHSEVKEAKEGKCPVCGMDLVISKKEQMKLDQNKQYHCPVHINMTSDIAGKCPQCGRPMNLSPKEKMKAEVMREFVCPMHPDVINGKGGKCPKCGMEMTIKK